MTCDISWFASVNQLQTSKAIDLKSAVYEITLIFFFFRLALKRPQMLLSVCVPI